MFHIEGAENELVALVSSSHVLAFTPSILTITSPSSSSVSVSVVKSDPFVLTFLYFSHYADDRDRPDG